MPRTLNFNAGQAGLREEPLQRKSRGRGRGSQNGGGGNRKEYGKNHTLFYVESKQGRFAKAWGGRRDAAQ